MSTAQLANGLTIAYESAGDPAQPMVLLVMGLGAQLVYWPDGFCAGLVERGFHVIRYDNRDVGLSSRIDGAPRPDVAAAFRGDVSSAAYTLRDMAADGIGLLDVLGRSSAHVVGVSLGGMIAQHMAMHYPERVLSLSSIMSAPTGLMSDDPPTAEARTALLRRPPATRDEALQVALDDAGCLGSPGFPMDEAWIRTRAGRHYDRGLDPRGIARQLLASLASGDWRAGLGGLGLPALVIHGDADPLIRPSWGRATAEAIPGAELVMIAGMGHDLPEGAWPVMLDAIERTIRRAPSQDQTVTGTASGVRI